MIDEYRIDKSNKEYEKDHFDVNKEKIILKELMTKNAGVVRNRANMEKALNKLEKMKDKLINLKISSKERAELYNMCFVAMEILKSAIKRKKSIGAHYRED